jgi:uncharacterized protein (TIGR02594 family)
MYFCLQRRLLLGLPAAACVLGIVAMDSAAEARPATRGAYVQVPQGEPSVPDSQYANSLHTGYAAADRPRRTRRVAAVGAIAGFGSSSLVAEARSWIGTNPTGQGSLWCGHFMNFVLSRTGHRVHNSNVARSFASYGRRLSGPRIGAIAVMSRGARGGHVGIVTGIDPSGNPIIVSGNVNKRVEEIPFPRSRILAYVTP